MAAPNVTDQIQRALRSGPHDGDGAPANGYGNTQLPADPENTMLLGHLDPLAVTPEEVEEVCQRLLVDQNLAAGLWGAISADTPKEWLFVLRFLSRQGERLWWWLGTKAVGMYQPSQEELEQLPKRFSTIRLAKERWGDLFPLGGYQSVKKRRQVYEKVSALGINPITEFAGLSKGYFTANAVISLEPEAWADALREAQAEGWSITQMESQINERKRKARGKGVIDVEPSNPGEEGTEDDPARDTSQAGVEAGEAQATGAVGTDPQTPASFTLQRDWARCKRRVDEQMALMREQLERDDGSAACLEDARARLEPVEEALFALDEAMGAEQRKRERGGKRVAPGQEAL